jgi:hypothetical protein
MKIFNQERWNMLSVQLKVAVACRYCYLPYYTNLIVQTGLTKEQVWQGLCNNIDRGSIKEEWRQVGYSWVKCFFYDDHIGNDYIDLLIRELA